jgi:hypothetical protein
MDGSVTRGIADFDFLIGSWAIENERLTTRLAGSTERERFSAISTCRRLLGGTGNLEEMTIPDRSFRGLALRIFDPYSGLWSIHWADNLRHRLLPPMVGRFENGQGTFLGDEEHAGKPVLARFIWFPSVEGPRWEQAFSADGGKTWETNWVMRYSRTR